jgi:hypothetical protein
MNTTVTKKTTLKEFVDFAFTLKEMEEVKKDNFPVPTSVTYSLDKTNLEYIQREVLKEKQISGNFSEEFEIELYGITFKFVSK